ncbi:hypothetical protein OIU74_020877 [Salix koriyanagi]|uniref:Uncharacterized protein n=1 Tax=Salix koriyanagi TaxID=2511006 RepID=A0A9Q0P6W1_9ROSI|nr:hypothetical protein OIU74_020877 [Salix koriyanagi]
MSEPNKTRSGSPPSTFANLPLPRGATKNQLVKNIITSAISSSSKK